MLAIAYTGVLAVVTTDPTDLTDSLIQQLHLSPRFAVGALAAVRLLPIMAGEWQTISLARRARGVAAGRSPLGAAAALRSGSCWPCWSAPFGAPRGWPPPWRRAASARWPAAPWPGRSAWRGRDWWLIAAAAALGLAAIGISLALGAWGFLFA